jgi:hypothetical protein
MPPLFAASGGGGHSRCGHRAALALGENAEAVDCKYLIPRKFPEIMTAESAGRSTVQLSRRRPVAAEPAFISKFSLAEACRHLPLEMNEQVNGRADAQTQ